MLIFITFSKRQILSLSFCCWWVWGRTQLNGLARLKKREQAKDHVHCLTLLKLLILLGIYIYLNHFMFHGNKTGCLILHFWEREGKMTLPADGGLVRSIQVLPGDLFLRYYLLTSLKSIDKSKKWMRTQTPSTHWTLVTWNGSLFQWECDCSFCQIWLVAVQQKEPGPWYPNGWHFLGVCLSNISTAALDCSCAFGFSDTVPTGLSWDLNDVQYTQR